MILFCQGVGFSCSILQGRCFNCQRFPYLRIHRLIRINNVHVKLDYWRESADSDLPLCFVSDNGVWVGGGGSSNALSVRRGSISMAPHVCASLHVGHVYISAQLSKIWPILHPRSPIRPFYFPIFFSWRMEYVFNCRIYRSAPTELSETKTR